MSLKKQAINGFIWTFAQQFSVQIINFVVQIILARLLLPQDFGLIAMITVFISISQTLMDGGMTSSLIRMKNPTQLDYSTVFVTNLIVSFGIYIIIYILSPFIADFYNQDLLKNILRVFALSFVIKSFIAVHIAKLTKEMNFKTQMKLQIPSTIIGAIVGVFMAYTDYGVWSLVWLNLVQTIIYTLQIWFFIKWRPSFIFEKENFKYHFNFGYKLTFSGLLDTIYNNGYRIVIGKFFSPALVGYYNQAETMRLFPVQQIGTVMGKVTYPLFSNIENDEKLRSAYKTTMKLVLLIVIPMMLILILLAKEIFTIVFGDKWLPAVPYFQILAIASIVRPISVYNLNVLKVKGRSDLFLKLEIIKKVIGVMAIIIGLPFGVDGLVITAVVVFYITVLIDMLYCGKIINYTLFDQIKDVSKLFIIGIVSYISSYFIYLNINDKINSDFILICIVSILFIVVYAIQLLIFEIEMIKQLKSILNLKKKK